MKKIRIASISCIKNESDIIETFIRVNSRVVHTFFFIDDSTDATREILRKLIKEEFHIIILENKSGITYFDQASIVNNAICIIREQYKDIDFDYILPLDCDEFPNTLSIENFTQELSKIPDDSIGNYFWETYIPISLEFSKLNKNGLTSCFQKRAFEGINFPKIIIPKTHFDKIIVDTGGHNAAYSGGMPCKTYTIQSQLAHFPVRSPEQIIRKNFTAVYGLMRKKSRSKGEGFHVYYTMAAILNKNIKINLKTLQKIAFEYASNNKFTIEPDIVELLKPSWIPDYQLKYLDQSNINFMEIFGNIIIESWLDPLPPNDLYDLCVALQNIDK